MASAQQYESLRHGAGFLVRMDRGRLQLKGRDRRSYLQGLLTNDIVALHAGSGCYAACLTPQGRMIADMRVFETGDRLLVDLHASRAAGVAERWAEFVFSEDVQVEDVTGATTQIGIYGPSAATALSNAALVALSHTVTRADLEHLPMYGNVVFQNRGGSVFVLRVDDDGVPGFEVVTGSAAAGAIVQALGAGDAVEVASDVLDVVRVEAGRPLFPIDMNEQTIPLEAGIEDRAISLTKGCYVGQEIIIRVLHRGHGRVARKLVKLGFEEGAAVPARGATLHAGDREIGAITSAVFSPALGRAVALGYVHRDFAEPGTAVECLQGDRVALGHVRE